MSTFFLALLLPATHAVLPLPAGWPKPDERIVCGPVVLEIYVSRTAHVFHVVDQISRWDNACHGQYREHMTLDADDEAALERYAAVRQKRRWGQGLEQTFYVPLGMDDAIRDGVKDGHLTSDEAKVIRPVLDRFAPRADELLSSKRPVLEKAFTKVDKQKLTRAAEELSRFTGVKKLVVPVFPLASPSPGGGGMDGGRLRWELDADAIHFSVLLHELTHGFFQQKNELLEAVVARTPGLTMTLLGEGFAYAMAPGLYPDGDHDQLLANVTADRANNEAWEDPSYGRQRTYALGLRPLFREALQGSGTLEAFLPRARDVFLAMQEVLGVTRPPGPPRLAVAGAASGVVRERLLDSKFHMWIQCLPHESKAYEEVLKQLGQGDLLVLLVTLDEGDRIPPDRAELAPLKLTELDQRLKRGESIAEDHEVQGGVRVVLLAAPTRKQIENLARTSPLLDG